MGRSTYVVELSVDPGGERRCELLVYSHCSAIEAIVRDEVASWTTEVAGDEDEPLAGGPPKRMLVWIVSRGVVVDAFDLKAFLAERADDTAPWAFSFDRLRQRLPPLVGKALEPGQSLAVSTTAFLAESRRGDAAPWRGSYVADLEGTLMYGCNDHEQEDRYPLLASDPYDPANTGVQAFLCAALARAASQGGFEDEEYFVEVLWSAPANPAKPTKGQRAGHLLCRDPDDAAGFAVLTQSGQHWGWQKTTTLDEALATLPPELAAQARDTLDEPARER